MREDEYQRLLVGLCAFVREHGELLEAHDHAGDADITVPPPDLPLDSAVDALFESGGLSAESTARSERDHGAQGLAARGGCRAPR